MPTLSQTESKFDFRICKFQTETRVETISKGRAE